MVVGCAVFGQIVMFAPLSGGCLNPAIGLVQPLFMKIVTEAYPNSFLDASGKRQSFSIDYIWMYVVGGSIGAALAGVAHLYLRPWSFMSVLEEMEKVEEAENEEKVAEDDNEP